MPSFFSQMKLIMRAAVSAMPISSLSFEASFINSLCASRRVIGLSQYGSNAGWIGESFALRMRLDIAVVLLNSIFTLYSTHILHTHNAKPLCIWLVVHLYAVTHFPNLEFVHEEHFGVVVSVGHAVSHANHFAHRNALPTRS